MLICVMPATIFSESDTETMPSLSLKDIIAGAASVEDVFGKLDAATVPEIIGYEYAIAKNHVKRLYSEEGAQLNKVVFLNADGTKTEYLYDYPVKYLDEKGKIQDISLKITKSSADGHFKTAASSSVSTFSQNITDGIELAGNGEKILLIPHLPSERDSSTLQINSVPTINDSVARMVDNKKVVYDYDPQTTIEYSLTYTGFKEDIVVSKYTGQTEYNFTLYTNGLKLVDKDGAFCLVDNTNTVKAILGDIIILQQMKRTMLWEN